MNLNFKFAIASDLHIALPQTISDHPTRFHLTEISIPALEVVLENLSQLDIEFLLIPGDLTQHGEPENHTWLAQRLSKLPYPVYVIPGNHDVPSQYGGEKAIAFADFPRYYRKFGYDNPQQLYYTCELLPNVQLIALNSNNFDEQGKQIGRLDDLQLNWLEKILSTVEDKFVIVMIHHNVIEHLPEQSSNPLGRRYMLENATALLETLQKSGVKLIFTGHLHIQDVSQERGIYEITTGSLVSYPHPYRILQFISDPLGNQWLEITSERVDAVPGYPNLGQTSKTWMGDRSFPFMVKLLTNPPLNIPLAEAEKLAQDLRDFWSNIADGDAIFNFEQLHPKARCYFEAFGANRNGVLTLIDNHAAFLLYNSNLYIQ